MTYAYHLRKEDIYTSRTGQQIRDKSSLKTLTNVEPLSHSLPPPAVWAGVPSQPRNGLSLGSVFSSVKWRDYPCHPLHWASWALPSPSPSATPAMFTQHQLCRRGRVPVQRAGRGMSPIYRWPSPTGHRDLLQAFCYWSLNAQHLTFLPTPTSSPYPSAK